MKIRRILCCCTALLLLVLTLAACTGGETGTSSAPGSTSSADSQPNAEKSIEDYVEKKDYGGHPDHSQPAYERGQQVRNRVCEKRVCGQL